MTIYAYVLQDSMGRFLTCINNNNRRYAMEYGRPKLYKTEGRARQAAMKHKRYPGLKVHRVKLEVINEVSIYGATSSSAEGERGRREKSRDAGGKKRVEKVEYRLPQGTI